MIDDTAGHHARATEWRWSAGVGEGPDGPALAWNLLSGVNDPPAGSERAVWVAGLPRHAPPVVFAADLSEIRCQDGVAAALPRRARARAPRRMLILSSDYRAPFGSFSGSSPAASSWRAGRGVMEHHRARW